MKKAFIAIFLCMIFLDANSQLIGKSFYNKKWEPTSKRNRYYTREIYKENDSSFLVNDYYLIDSLEMLGHLKSVDPEIEHGLFTFYYASGFKHFEGNYCNGTICGKWITYNKYGNPTDTINYDYSIPDCEVFDTTENAYIKKDSMNYVVVDEMPRFISKKYRDFGSYIQDVMFIPPLINKYRLSGKANIKFTVDVNGLLCGIELQDDNYNQSIAKEAIRILLLSPRWKPALSNNYPVPVNYKMPITIE